MTINSEAAIFSRVLEPEKPMLSEDAARSILALDFTRADRERMQRGGHIGACDLRRR